MNNTKRISPLRGLGPEDIVSQTKVVRNGLSALRDDHYGILTRIRQETATGTEKNDNDKGSSLLEQRIDNVTRSLERLEVGIEESSALLGLHEHFERLEADRATLRLEMERVQDENDWLREELSSTQQRLQEAELELTDLQEEKRKWDFEEELRSGVTESQARPVTPSKIPVGSWRVEEEKDINRALNGERPPAPSRIPMGNWRSKAGSAYRSLLEKEENRRNAAASAAAAGSAAAASKIPKKGQYFKLNAASGARGASKIPSR